MALAIFDLDNTLLNGDSDHAWGEYLVQHGKVDAKAYQEANDYFYQQYKQAKLDIHEYLEFALKPLTQHSIDTLAAWHAEFMQTTVEPMLQSKAFELLEKHRDAGDFLLIITATNAFVTQPIATRLGVDAILAT
ncbi:MAG: HAD-IB family phosphatase, partial [Sinobacterium sp.]|nr:HAD-IB family phosphatase [Sinobacterium sp.]